MKARDICKDVMQSDTLQDIYCSDKGKKWERNSKDFSKSFSYHNGGRSSSRTESRAVIDIVVTEIVTKMINMIKILAIIPIPQMDLGV